MNLHWDRFVFVRVFLVWAVLFSSSADAAERFASDWANAVKSRARLVADGAGGAAIEISWRPTRSPIGVTRARPGFPRRSIFPRRRTRPTSRPFFPLPADTDSRQRRLRLSRQGGLAARSRAYRFFAPDDLEARGELCGVRENLPPGARNPGADSDERRLYALRGGNSRGAGARAKAHRAGGDRR